MPSARQGSIHLIRIAGIDLFLHWSWFLVAVYEIQTRKGDYSSMTWNVLEYLALFLIVTLHEFGHALACRQVGGTANQIVLWPLGGVAYVDPPQRPGATLWSIAAGPLVNVALVPILDGVVLIGRSQGWAESAPDVYALLRNILGINLLLLIFNILPIYPLDGGQIFRSLLWFMLGRARSLMVATVVGINRRSRVCRPRAVDAIHLVWSHRGLHADELLGRTPTGARAIKRRKTTAQVRRCLSVLQDIAAYRRTLEVQSLRPAIRHFPGTWRLPSLWNPISGHEVHGLRQGNIP